MKKSGIEFKVRRWTDNETESTPFDVVALDHDNNKQHYQPGVLFGSELKAASHCFVLQNRIQENPETIQFVRDHWPVDGGIE